jgi:hypothetical protein
MAGNDVSRYVVRAYDLGRGRLLPGRIADRTQRGWVMQGMPVSRATSEGGRWVYTLYTNPGGYPFVHALDTVRSQAHCIGVPWKGKQDAVWKLRLRLADSGRTLRLDRASGRPYLTIATGTWRISYPAAARRSSTAGFPWWIAGVGVALLLLARPISTRARARFRAHAH